jgi:hypothetical protein
LVLEAGSKRRLYGILKLDKEGIMKKIAVLMMVMMLTVVVSVAMAGPGGDEEAMLGAKAGKLFLFQKCDGSGCPASGSGPWPILPTGRWGQLNYNLLGDEFKFSFEGKKLAPKTRYALIYYPDPWPGNNLICLGTGKSGGAGNLQINGSREILDPKGNPTGLPASYDANFYPMPDSGAVGAKIWLVLENDVQCITDKKIPGPPQMLGWNPASYLFEGNLIVYQYSLPPSVADDDQ